MSTVIRDSQENPNPRASLLATQAALAAVQRGLAPGARAIASLPRFPLMAGDPASDAGTRIGLDELTPELAAMIESGGGSPNAFVSGGNSFGGDKRLGLLDNFALTIITNGLGRIFIDEDGSVGIGALSTGADFDVAGDAHVAGVIVADDSSASVNTNSRRLIDGLVGPSLDWLTRRLLADDGVTEMLQWDDPGGMVANGLTSLRNFIGAQALDVVGTPDGTGGDVATFRSLRSLPMPAYTGVITCKAIVDTVAGDDPLAGTIGFGAYANNIPPGTHAIGFQAASFPPNEFAIDYLITKLSEGKIGINIPPFAPFDGPGLRLFAADGVVGPGNKGGDIILHPGSPTDSGAHSGNLIVENFNYAALYQAAQGYGNSNGFIYQAGAHTSQDNAEANDVLIDLMVALELLGGGAAIPEFRSVLIQPRILNALAPQVIDRASTVRITGGPSAGANVTFGQNAFGNPASYALDADSVHTKALIAESPGTGVPAVSGLQVDTDLGPQLIAAFGHTQTGGAPGADGIGAALGFFNANSTGQAAFSGAIGAVLTTALAGAESGDIILVSANAFGPAGFTKFTGGMTPCFIIGASGFSDLPFGSEHLRVIGTSRLEDDLAVLGDIRATDSLRVGASGAVLSDPAEAALFYDLGIDKLRLSKDGGPLATVLTTDDVSLQVAYVGGQAIGENADGIEISRGMLDDVDVLSLIRTGAGSTGRALYASTNNGAIPVEFRAVDSVDAGPSTGLRLVHHNFGVPASGIAAALEFSAKNDQFHFPTAARIRGGLTNVTEPVEDGEVSLDVMIAGLLSTVGVLDGNGLFVLGNVHASSRLSVAGTQVVGPQGALVADAAGGVVIDTEARTAVNDLLARLRAHGLIAT